MDLTKKRKLDENGFPESDPIAILSPNDVRKILEPFSPDQLLDILQNAVVSHPDVLDSVRAIADRDVTQRKLFVRGLGWETTSESLRAVFATFGELEEAVVILDKETSKSKGYGFVTYKHIDGAILALKEPSKKIDGRVAVAQLASAGLSGGPGSNASSGPNSDVSMRKIYVGNVPYDMSGERLLSLFSSYGEIEEGPLGFDKQTGKSKGFALFVYKTPDAAQAALMEPMKNIDGRQVVCKMASEGKKGKGFVGPGQGQGNAGNGMGMQPGGPAPGPYGGPGGPGGYSSYGGGGGGGGYAGGPPGGMGQNPMNSGYSSSVGAQGPGGYGGSGGYGGGYGGSQYGGPNSGGYGGYGGPGNGGPNSGGYGPSGGGPGRGGSMYGMPPSSAGVPSGGGGYPDGGHYGGYPSQPHQQTGTSPATRVPPAGGAGGYPNVPTYY